jgi:hypothetical protein
MCWPGLGLTVSGIACFGAFGVGYPKLTPEQWYR